MAVDAVSGLEAYLMGNFIIFPTNHSRTEIPEGVSGPIIGSALTQEY